jgi:hypothetical protein
MVINANELKSIKSIANMITPDKTKERGEAQNIDRNELLLRAQARKVSSI